MKVDREARTITLRQSSFNTFLLCPERARLDMLYPDRDRTTDAAAIGTAVHAGIEHALQGGDTPLLVACSVLEELWDDLVKVQVKQLHTAQQHVSRLVNAWCAHVYPQLSAPLAIEEGFNLPLAEVRGWDIRMSGTIDYIDEHYNVFDWKTGSRPYEQWEADRYKIQPTVYGWAINQLHGHDPVSFSYVVLLKTNPVRVQWLDVERNGGHWAWMLRQIESIVALIDADLDLWPLNDQSALCSRKWCGHWSECKGAFL